MCRPTHIIHGVAAPSYAQEFDRVAKKLEELPAGRDGAREIPVIVGEGVRHDQVRPATDGHPVQQLVVVGESH